MKKLINMTLLLGLVAVLSVSCDKANSSLNGDKDEVTPTEGVLTIRLKNPKMPVVDDTKVNTEHYAGGLITFKWEVGDEVCVYTFPSRRGQREQHYKFKCFEVDGDEAVFKMQSSDASVITPGMKFVLAYPYIDCDLDEREAEMRRQLKAQKNGSTSSSYDEGLLVFLESEKLSKDQFYDVPIAVNHKLAYMRIVAPWRNTAGKPNKLEIKSDEYAATVTASSGFYAIDEAYYPIIAVNPRDFSEKKFTITIEDNKGFKETFSKEFNVIEKGEYFYTSIPYYAGDRFLWDIGYDNNGTIWADRNLGTSQGYFNIGGLYQWGSKKKLGYKANDDSNDPMSDRCTEPTAESALDLWADEIGDDTYYVQDFWFTTEGVKETHWAHSSGYPVFFSNSTYNNFDDETYGLSDSPTTEMSGNVRYLGNPCPKGWRVPTIIEWYDLFENMECEYLVDSFEDSFGHKYDFPYVRLRNTETNKYIDFPLAGQIVEHVESSGASPKLDFRERGSYGYYWTNSMSTNSDVYAAAAIFHDDSYYNDLKVYVKPLGTAASVRCVRDYDLK